MIFNIILKPYTTYMRNVYIQLFSKHSIYTNNFFLQTRYLNNGIETTFVTDINSSTNFSSQLLPPSFIANL